MATAKFTSASNKYFTFNGVGVDKAKLVGYDSVSLPGYIRLEITGKGTYDFQASDIQDPNGVAYSDINAIVAGIVANFPKPSYGASSGGGATNFNQLSGTATKAQLPTDTFYQDSATAGKYIGDAVRDFHALNTQGNFFSGIINPGAANRPPTTSDPYWTVLVINLNSDYGTIMAVPLQDSNGYRGIWIKTHTGGSNYSAWEATAAKTL